MHDRPMTWDETFRAIRCGDMGVLTALLIETVIMLSPIAILVGAWYAGS